MLSIKELLTKILTTDLVIEQGTDSNGFSYKKYASGRLEAEKAWNTGQYTISNVEIAPIRVGGIITVATPIDMTSGDVDVTLMGNTVSSACFIEHIGNGQFRIAKVANSTIVLQGLTVCIRTVGARWK